MPIMFTLSALWSCHQCCRSVRGPIGSLCGLRPDGHNSRRCGRCSRSPQSRLRIQPAPGPEFEHVDVRGDRAGGDVCVRRRHARGPAPARRTSGPRSRPAHAVHATTSSRSHWPCTTTTTSYKCLPAAYIADKDGKPLHSWRVALLPYLEQQPSVRTVQLRRTVGQPQQSGAGPADARRLSLSLRPVRNGGQSVELRGDRGRSVLRSRSNRCSCPITGPGSEMSPTEPATPSWWSRPSNPVPWTQPDADPRVDQFVSQFTTGGSRTSHPGGANVVAGGWVRAVPGSDSGCAATAAVVPAERWPAPDVQLVIVRQARTSRVSSTSRGD